MKTKKGLLLTLLIVVCLWACKEHEYDAPISSVSSIQSEMKVVPLFKPTDLCVKIAGDMDFQKMRLASDRITMAIAKCEANGISLSELDKQRLTDGEVIMLCYKLGFSGYDDYMNWAAATQVTINKVKSKFGTIDPLVLNNAVLLTTEATIDPRKCVYGYQKCNIENQTHYNEKILACGVAAFTTMTFNPPLGFGVYLVCGSYAMSGQKAGGHICAIDYKTCMLPELYVTDDLVKTLLKTSRLRTDLIIQL